MSATEALTRSSSKVDTGLTDSTYSSSTSSSAERFGLDEFDERPILLYNHRKGLKGSSQRDLCAMLDKDESIRCTKMPIPRFHSYLDVKQHDLFTDYEKERYSTKPNFDTSVAMIKLPADVYWKRLLFGAYNNLYMLSPMTKNV